MPLTDAQTNPTVMDVLHDMVSLTLLDRLYLTNTNIHSLYCGTSDVELWSQSSQVHKSHTAAFNSSGSIAAFPKQQQLQLPYHSKVSSSTYQVPGNLSRGYQAFPKGPTPAATRYKLGGSVMGPSLRGSCASRTK